MILPFLFDEIETRKVSATFQVQVEVIPVLLLQQSQCAFGFWGDENLTQYLLSGLQLQAVQ